VKCAAQEASFKRPAATGHHLRTGLPGNDPNPLREANPKKKRFPYPPNVAQWKDDGTDYSGTQFRYGPRVPCIVVSPYAKKGYISKNFHSHVSIVKFCLKTFGLRPLGALDVVPGDLSDDMMDCFDFTQAPLKPPLLPGKK